MIGIALQFRAFFVSLRLTVALLAASIVLIFWATLAQADLGVWGVQQKFFHSLFVLERVPGSDFPIPVFPGGYLIGGLLFANLLAAQITRFRLTWRKAGIWLTHAGIILLLLGELLSGILQRDDSMVLDTGQTRNYSESERCDELAITDATGASFDEVVAIPGGGDRREQGAPAPQTALPDRAQNLLPERRSFSRARMPQTLPPPLPTRASAPRLRSRPSRRPPRRASATFLPPAWN